MMKNQISKAIYAFTICTFVFLAVLSCDEDNNVFMDNGSDNGDDMLLGDPGTASPTLNFTGIGIDYDPEARCSDNNWSTNTPAACNPQLSFTCTGNMDLSTCPTTCQACYDSDMDTIKTTLNVDMITIYQPNYYILTAAEAQSLEVILGLFNDEVAALASRHCSSNTSTPCVDDTDCTAMNDMCVDATSGCTFAGANSLCGTGHANALLNGACDQTTPWAADTFCSMPGAYITPNADFISSGTVIGIQIGNEVLSSSDPSLTKDEVVRAAKVMSNAIAASSAGLPDIPMIVSLVAGNEANFCESGAPPAGVDYIAAHPYCNDVASVPPMWPFETGNTAEMAAKMCWDQVTTIFTTISQADCGADTTYIGETGYNTGCPMSTGESTHLSVAPHFFDEAVSWTCMQSLGTFLFAFVDACPPVDPMGSPMDGCQAGCSTSATPAGNGYFGIYHTDSYNTMGLLVQKYTPLPTLTCPTPTPSP